jgi:hypothetical protein
VASYGNVSDEVILEYIRTQEATRDDDDFRVEDTRAGRLSRAFSRLPSPPASSRRWISSHTRQITNHGQRPWYEEGPPEGAVSVR